MCGLALICCLNETFPGGGEQKKSCSHTSEQTARAIGTLTSNEMEGIENRTQSKHVIFLDKLIMILTGTQMRCRFLIALFENL